MPHFAYKILHGLFSILFQTHLFLFTMVSHWTPAILASYVSLKHMDLDLTMPNSLLPLGLCTSCYLCLPVVCLEHSSLVPSCFFRSQQEACLLSKGEACLKYLIILSHHPILIPGHQLTMPQRISCLFTTSFHLNGSSLTARTSCFFLANIFPLPGTVGDQEYQFEHININNNNNCCLL